MGLLTGPSSFDGRSHSMQGAFTGVMGEIVLTLSIESTLTYPPATLCGSMLSPRKLCFIGDPYAQSGKLSAQWPLCPLARQLILRNRPYRAIMVCAERALCESSGCLRGRPAEPGRDQTSRTFSGYTFCVGSTPIAQVSSRALNPERKAISAQKTEKWRSSANLTLSWIDDRECFKMSLRTRLPARKVTPLKLIKNIVFIGMLMLVDSGPISAETLSCPGMHVTILNIRNSIGTVDCALFDTPGGFPVDVLRSATRLVAMKIRNTEARCDFEDIAPGTYALVVLHDENMNGKLDTNWLGIPKEGYGFSRDAKAAFAAPSYSDASFEYDGQTLALTVTLRY